MGKKTIKLKRYDYITNELVAAEAITPGALLELNGDGKVQNHSTAGGAGETMTALENELVGETIEDDYAADDQVFAWNIQSGEEALMLINSNDDPSPGDHLESNGNGELTTTSTGNAEKLFTAIGEKQVDDDGNHRVPCRRL